MISNIFQYKNIKPKIDKNVLIAPGAFVVGDEIIDTKTSIWFNVVIRGDVEKLRIG